MKRILTVTIIAVLGLAVLATLALAGPGKGHRGDGQGQGQREGGPGREGGGKRAGVIFGTILSKSGDTWTVRPEVPPHMRERMQERGKQLPDLPDQVQVTVGSATEFWLDGAASSAKAFDQGAEVVIKLDKPLREGGSVAQAVADPETAREYIMEKIKDRGEGGGPGQDGPGGEGRGDRRGHHPMFGTVTSISSTSITIKPEVPQFIKDKMAQRQGGPNGREGGPGGGKGMRELPDSITVSLTGDTRYCVNSQMQDSDPFKAGDKVAIAAQGERGSESAKIVSDYASAQQRMQELGDKMQKRQGKGKGSSQ